MFNQASPFWQIFPLKVINLKKNSKGKMTLQLTQKKKYSLAILHLKTKMSPNLETDSASGASSNESPSPKEKVLKTLSGGT